MHLAGINGCFHQCGSGLTIGTNGGDHYPANLSGGNGQRFPERFAGDSNT